MSADAARELASAEAAASEGTRSDGAHEQPLAMAPAAARGDAHALPTADAHAPGETHAPARHWTERLAHNLAWNAIADLAARGASLGLALVCARALPVPAFGRFAFALSLTQYVWLAGDTLANAGYATREVARVRGHDPASARRLKGRILALRLAAAAAITLIAGLALWLVPMPGELRGALAGASGFFLAYAAFPDWALRAREDFRGLALANVASALALFGGAALLLPRHPSAGMATALWSASFAVAALVALTRLLHARAFAWHGEAGPLHLHARRSLVFSLGAMGGIGCAQAPMLVVGLLATPLAAGLFGASYRFMLVVINGFSVLWWPLMPVLVRSRPGEPQFREALSAMGRVVLLLGLPAMLAFALWPRELLALAFGARYVEGAASLRLAGAVVPLFAATALLEQTCLALGGEALRARINVLALALLVGLGVALVPTHGPTGAAAALVATYATTLAGYAIAYRHALPWRELGARARAPLALNAVLAAAWLAARALHAPAAWAIGLAAAAYVGAVFAFRLLPRRGGLSAERAE